MKLIIDISDILSFDDKFNSNIFKAWTLLSILKFIISKKKLNSSCLFFLFFLEFSIKSISIFSSSISSKEILNISFPVNSL